MDELTDVHEAGIVFAVEECYYPPQNEYLNCKSSYYVAGSPSYTGQWKNKMPNGRGTLILRPDSQRITRYDGIWKNGVPCGKGRIIYTYPNSRSSSYIIEGEFDAKGNPATGSSSH